MSRAGPADRARGLLHPWRRGPWRLAILSAVAALLVVMGRPAGARPAKWSTGTAHTLPAGRLEVGLFQPLRYGATDTFEFSTHPLANVLIPNWSVKAAVFDAGDWSAAVRHSLHYPTPLLRLLAREGTGGVLPATAKVPQIIGWNAELFATYSFSPTQMATGRFSMLLAARFGESEMPTIDLPIVFPRTAAYHNTASFAGGLDFDGQIVGGLWYLVDLDLFLMPWDQGVFALEHSVMINWRVTGGFAVHLGYKMVFGEYPFGTQLHLLPLLDLQLAWD